MKPDLQGLEITGREIKHLSGININNLYRKKLTSWKILSKYVQYFLLAASAWLLVIVIFRHLYFSFLNLLILLFAFILTFRIFMIRKYICFSKNNNVFFNILDDADKYNNLIIAIDISDKLESAGNTEVAVKDRDKVIEALKLTREDLIRAFKTEKILRNNQQFISQNSELFHNNLSALSSLQISNKASELSSILNEALQIAIDTKKEINQMQNNQTNLKNKSTKNLQ